MTFKQENILKIIRLSNINESYDQDDISIRMLKTCAAKVVKPLSLKAGFNIISNIVPVHKEDDNRCMVNPQ